jgi:hypothetical protein
MSHAAAIPPPILPTSPKRNVTELKYVDSRTLRWRTSWK